MKIGFSEKVDYSVESFVKADIFSNEYFYKIKFLGFARFETTDVECFDLYFSSHDNIYLIKTGSDKKTSKSNLEISQLGSPHQASLHSVVYDVANDCILDISYFLPKDKTLLKQEYLIEDKANLVFKTNIFRITIDKNLNRVQFNFLYDGETESISSVDFFKTNFSHYDAISLLENSILSNDKYTIESVSETTRKKYFASKASDLAR